MALTSSGAISMNDMRTEFGISGAISMDDLYRGGSEVPSSKATSCTVSEIANVLCGVGYAGARTNHGNAVSPCGQTENSANYGYFRGGVTPSSSISWDVDGGVKFTFYYNASWSDASSAPPATVLDLVFDTTGTYTYGSVSYEASNGSFLIGTSGDTDAYASQTLGSSGAGGAVVVRTGTFSVTAGSTYRLTITLPYSGGYSNIYNLVAIAPSIESDFSDASRTMTGLNSSVPTSGTITFANMYGAQA